MRAVLLALGAGLAAYGGWLLVSRQDLAAWLTVLVWLAAGVVLHDGVLAPLVTALGRLDRRLPGPVALAGVVVLVVLGSVTLVAVPVLGRFGERPDVPSLLPRDYPAGWLLVAAAVLLGAILAALRSARAGRRPHGQGPRGR
jgi:hypothetical protein